MTQRDLLDLSACVGREKAWFTPLGICTENNSNVLSAPKREMNWACEDAEILFLEKFFFFFFKQWNHLSNDKDKVLHEVVTMGNYGCLVRCILIYLVAFLVCESNGEGQGHPSTPPPPVKPQQPVDNGGPQPFPDEENTNLPVFTMDYPRIQLPFEITLWILLASFAKIGENNSYLTNH